MRYNNISLRIKFIGTVSLFFVIVMFSGAHILTLKRKNIMRSFALQKGESILNLVAETAASPLFTRDTAELDLIIDTVLTDEEIAYIFIEDRHGDVINPAENALNIAAVEYGKWGITPGDTETVLQNLLSINTVLHIQAPVFRQKKSIGTVYLGLFTADSAKPTKKFITTMIPTIVIVILLLSGLLYLLFNNLVLSPLNNISAVSEKIASGDLNAVVEIKNNDEIGRVADTINTMTGNLKSMVLSIQDLFSRIELTAGEADGTTKVMTANMNERISLIRNILSTMEQNADSLKEVASKTGELKNASEETSASILELTSSTGEIANNMDVLSEEIDNTTSSLKLVSSSLDELVEAVTVLSKAAEDTSTSTEEINTSAKEIEKLSADSRSLVLDIKQQTAQTGLRSINRTIEGMKKIKESVEITGEIIKILDSKSQEINKILQVIDQVADRTTLLSLNAAILAAQAGTGGTAFAVVAGEIKLLATDTSASTKEIAEIITMIQREIKVVVESMEHGISNVTHGTKLAEEAGRIFNDITTGTRKSSDFSEKITIATREQMQGIAMVTTAVRSINERIERLYAVVKEQKEGIDNILLSIERIRDIAGQVTLSADEQRKSSSKISVSAETVYTMSSSIAESLNIIRENCSEVLDSVDIIKQNARDDVTASSEISRAINALLNKASILKETIQGFTV